MNNILKYMALAEMAELHLVQMWAEACQGRYEEAMDEQFTFLYYRDLAIEAFDAVPQHQRYIYFAMQAAAIGTEYECEIPC